MVDIHDDSEHLFISEPLLAENERQSSNSEEEEEEEKEDKQKENEIRTLSNCDTIIHLLKGNIGTGILAIPNAIKNSGLLFGNVGLVFMAIICVTCMHKLIRCSVELSLRHSVSSLSYSEVASHSVSNPRLSKFAKRTIDFFLILTQLGFCCVYLVFVSQNLSALVTEYLGNGSSSDSSFFVLLALFIPTLALVSVRNLKILAPISMLANFLQISGLICIFKYLLQEIPKTWERPMIAPLNSLPLYFGTAIYAFEGIGVVLPLENQMRTPSSLGKWNGVLNTSMGIVSVLYIATGFFGYLKYGNEIKGSITLNLPIDEMLSQGIILVMSLAIFLSYGLQFFVPFLILLPFVKERVGDRYQIWGDYALRYALVFLTFLLSSSVKQLDSIISLVGAVSSSTLALMAPPLIDILTFRHYSKPLSKELWINIGIFIFGLIGFLTGTYASIYEMIMTSSNLQTL